MGAGPGVWLQRTDEQAAELDHLAALAQGRVGVHGVLDDLDRQGRSTWVPGLKVDYGFTWDREDAATRRWWPQGITTSADATETEDIRGRRVLATSWYAREVGGVHQGSRITFVDLATLRYRHVLLVRPVARDGEVRFEPLRVHAGGIVWCGPYLHIAGTGRGIFTGRLDDIVRAPDAGALPAAETFGYRYLLPVRFAYRAGADEGVERLRYSFLSLDRTAGEPRLIAGEYGLRRRRQTTRLVGYPLDPQTFHLRAGPAATARPLLWEERGTTSMQGAALVGETWYVTASRTPYGLGTLYVGRPGAWHAHRWALPFGPEDIAYWPSRDTLWSVTEHPHRRWVYALDRARLDD